MRISDQELREKVLAFLALKGTVSSVDVVRHCETWVGASKTREMLKALEEEDEITSSRLSENKSAKQLWAIKTPSDVQVAEAIAKKQAQRENWSEAEVVDKITEFLSTPEKRSTTVKDFDKAMNTVFKDADIEAALARELSLMLRKQERRKYWAEAVLKTSNGMIALINEKIKELA